MKSKVLRIVLIAVPLGCVVFFLYMTFFHSSYEHPGRYVYMDHCASCHGEKGEGIQQLVPPLADADMARAQFDSLPCWIQSGMNGPVVVNGRTYDQPMYPTTITDIEMTNLLNYLATEMVHTDRHYKSEMVEQMMRSCRR